MSDASDMELVRAFASRSSEEAFAELVCRHVNLVHSTALRLTGNGEDAKDVTQAVFIVFAKKAANLREGTVLAGWLYETTRFTAARWLRTQARRCAREREACMQSALNSTEPESQNTWRQLAPYLDAGMSELRERDRVLLALRFFENKTGAEAAELMGIEEAAAHKRTARALDKLRGFFVRRGIVVSAGAIIAAVSAHAVQAAPAGLRESIITVGLARGAAAGSSTAALVKGTLKIMAWTKAKTVTVAGIVLVTILGAGKAITVVHSHFAHAARVVYPYEPNEPTRPEYEAELAKLRATAWPGEIAQAKGEIQARQQVDDTVNSTRINLKPYMNEALTNSPASIKGIRDNNLAELPSGTHVFGGVPFDVQGFVQLYGSNMAGFRKSFPAAVNDIPINRKCARLHLLHGANWVDKSDFGTTVAKLVLHYEDGSTREIPMVAGEQVFDWWATLFTSGVDPRLFQMADGTERAWTGSNPFIRRYYPDECLVLYKSSFQNPQPDIVVTSLDYVSTGTGIAPFLLGLTVD